MRHFWSLGVVAVAVGAMTSGKWLVAEKAKRSGDQIDVAWLKDYPGGPEQK